ncbi:sep15/selm redox domain [Bacteriophage sp.]|nr:sep15/selm redox domain [Bacteriophage sp.]
MNFNTLKSEIKGEAIKDAAIFVDENGEAFDRNSSGEYETVSVREYLKQRGIKWNELPDGQYDELVELYAETIADESESLAA